MTREFRELRKIRRTKRMGGVASVNLVSMIDCFIIIIIYLLVNTAAVQVMGAELVNLPESLAEEQPRERVAVIISNNDILVDGEPLMTVEAAKALPGEVLVALQRKLLEKAPPVSGQPGGPASPENDGEVNILADRGIKYSLLKRVMVTCTAARFGNISLGVTPAS